MIMQVRIMLFYPFLLLAGSLSLSSQPPGLKGTFDTVSSFHNLLIRKVAIDSTNAIVVAGTTTQAGLPTTPNAIQRDYRATTCFDFLPPFNRPCTDSYVAKISRDGTVLYGSYFGGSCDDTITSMAVDETDSIYLLGNTCSSNAPFTQPAPPQSAAFSFIVKIAADGTWNYALRLPAGVSVRQIRSGGAGEIVLGGECTLNSLPWSATFLAPNSAPRAGACYVRLASNGIDIVAATILGGSNDSLATDISLDASGNAYLTGKTFPPDFPANSQSWVNTTPQTFFNFALFAALVSRDGKILLGSAMFSGEDFDDDPKIAIGSSGEVVIAGKTGSYHFPVTPGAFETIRVGEVYDGNLFVVKLTADLSAPVFSTYLSGEGTDNLESISVNDDGSVTLIGETHSTLFPTTPDAQERCLMADYYPTFVPYLTLLAADGKSLVYSSFFNRGPKGGNVTAAALGQGFSILAMNPGDIVLLDPSRPPARPQFCAMNAANFRATGVTAGEIVTIFGSGLSGAQILVGGQPASVLYASDNQVNAIVPDSIQQGAPVTIAAIHQDTVAGQTDMPAVNYVAGLFRHFGTPMIVANNDDGTPIDESNPAKPGSTIRVYGTGFGNTHPKIRLGSSISEPISSRQADGVVEFRVLVPEIPAGQSQARVDFTIDGISFQATGLKLPIAIPGGSPP